MEEKRDIGMEVGYLYPPNPYDIAIDYCCSSKIEATT